MILDNFHFNFRVDSSLVSERYLEYLILCLQAPSFHVLFLAKFLHASPESYVQPIVLGVEFELLNLTVTF
jgi:hypothetical protein